LDAEGKTEAGKIAEMMREQMNNPQLEVEAQSLVTDDLPAFLVMEENQRRFRDYMMAMDPNMAGGKMAEMHKRKLIVNTNSPLINAIHSLANAQPELAKELAQEVYQLALLSHREMEPAALPDFVHRTSRVLERLAKMAVSGTSS
jgi:molecular chaperone HtpG